MFIFYSCLNLNSDFDHIKYNANSTKFIDNVKHIDKPACFIFSGPKMHQNHFPHFQEKQKKIEHLGSSFYLQFLATVICLNWAEFTKGDSNATDSQKSGIFLYKLQSGNPKSKGHWRGIGFKCTYWLKGIKHFLQQWKLISKFIRLFSLLK